MRASPTLLQLRMLTDALTLTRIAQGFLLGGRLLRLAGKWGSAEKMLRQAAVKAGTSGSAKMVHHFSIPTEATTCIT